MSIVAAGGISGEHISVIAMVSSGVAAVLLGFTWLDARWDAKLKAHAAAERKLQEVKDAAILSEIRCLLAEHRAADAEAQLGVAAAGRPLGT